MYLEHFGLKEPPFKITPVTDFFFSGANRGEILDAMVYAITDGEGIVKVSGEVGSGKTMLCRMLLEKLPANIKAIYLANPSMTRDELLYAIADRLELDLEGKRVSVILQTLQNRLETMYQRGERCVVLVDEAHAMPLDTLEELRLLYNLQMGKHKLLQIVLFGQPELDEKLAQSNMRQLKDRIVHHFTILPLSPKVIHAYLMFRMRAAGYKGPDNFTEGAEKLIAKASHGLMRRVNILADKALLAAFVENTHTIQPRHVEAAIRDSEMRPMHGWFTRRNTPLLAGAALSAAMLAGAAVFILRQPAPASPSAPQIAALPSSPAMPATQAMEPAASPAPAASAPAAEIPLPASAATPGNGQAITETTPASTPVPAATNADWPQLAELKKVAPGSLLEQRLEASQAMLSSAGKGSASIQLFYTENTDAARMEGFLTRAQKLGVLDEIYILPIRIKGRLAYRVLYGVFANSNAALAGMDTLPPRYQEAFAPTLYLLNNLQNPPQGTSD